MTVSFVDIVGLVEIVTVRESSRVADARRCTVNVGGGVFVSLPVIPSAESVLDGEGIRESEAVSSLDTVLLGDGVSGIVTLDVDVPECDSDRPPLVRDSENDALRLRVLESA